MDLREALIDWDDPDEPGNVMHIAEHGLTPEEVESVLCDDHPRTPEQIAEEQAIHEHYKAHPIREVPKTAIKTTNFMALLDLFVAFKATRESQGLAVPDVAAKMGIEPATLTKLEACRDINPTIATLIRWAEVLGQKLDFKLGPEQGT